MVLLRGTGNKVVVAERPRSSASAERALFSGGKQTNLPTNSPPRTDASTGSTSSMKSKEGAGGTSTALLTSFCAAQAAARPLGVFARNHRVIAKPPAKTFYPPSASVTARTAVAPPTLQLFFPCRQFQALPSVCKKSFIRLKTATAVTRKARSKLYMGLHKLQDVRAMFRV